MENLNKYQNGKIYKITDNAYTECYIGSTTQPLCNRMADHRKKYNQYKRGDFHFITLFRLFDKYGLDNCKIELVEDVSCDRKEHLRKVEGEHISRTDCINRRVEGRSKKQYYLEHIDDVKKYLKNYYDERRDAFIDKQANYYDVNRDKINERKREKVVCPQCGMILSKGSLWAHKKLHNSE